MAVDPAVGCEGACCGGDVVTEYRRAPPSGEIAVGSGHRNSGASESVDVFRECEITEDGRC